MGAPSCCLHALPSILKDGTPARACCVCGRVHSDAGATLDYLAGATLAVLRETLPTGHVDAARALALPSAGATVAAPPMPAEWTIPPRAINLQRVIWLLLERATGWDATARALDAADPATTGPRARLYTRASECRTLARVLLAETPAWPDAADDHPPRAPIPPERPAGYPANTADPQDAVLERVLDRVVWHRPADPATAPDPAESGPPETR